jgi:P27 family predicted phage terminase small subunit
MARGGARLGAGRPRKSAAQHELQGTVRPSRMNPNEPRYPVTAPEKPAHIEANAIASAEWDRVAPLLVEQRVMTDAYRAAFEAYTLAYGAMVAAEQTQAAPGFKAYVKAGKSGLRAHPAIKAANDARAELRQWAAVLGLLPTTVGKVSAAPLPEAQDDEDALLARLERRTFDVVDGGKASA